MRLRTGGFAIAVACGCAALLFALCTNDSRKDNPTSSQAAVSRALSDKEPEFVDLFLMARDGNDVVTRFLTATSIGPSDSRPSSWPGSTSKPSPRRRLLPQLALRPCETKSDCVAVSRELNPNARPITAGAMDQCRAIVAFYADWLGKADTDIRTIRHNEFKNMVAIGRIVPFVPGELSAQSREAQDSINKYILQVQKDNKRAGKQASDRDVLAEAMFLYMATVGVVMEKDGKRFVARFEQLPKSYALNNLADTLTEEFAAVLATWAELNCLITPSQRKTFVSDVANQLFRR